jgi:N-methylhydantoinase A
LVHGITIGSNTLLAGKNAITGMTRGFRDEPEIRRMALSPVFDFLWKRTQPLIPRRRRIEVPKRITAREEVFAPLNPADVRQAIASLKFDGIEAIAICSINSFANPLHVQEAAALEVADSILSAPNVLSHDCSHPPRFR